MYMCGNILLRSSNLSTWVFIEEKFSIPSFLSGTLEILISNANSHSGLKLLLQLQLWNRRIFYKRLRTFNHFCTMLLRSFWNMLARKWCNQPYYCPRPTPLSCSLWWIGLDMRFYGWKWILRLIFIWNISGIMQGRTLPPTTHDKLRAVLQLGR